MTVILTRDVSRALEERSPRAVFIDFGAGAIFRALGRPAKFPPRVFPFAAALIAAAPRRLSVGELIDYRWGDEAEGGPDFAVEIVRGAVSLMRRPEGLPSLEISIHCDWGWGWRAVIL